jgi:hypothetical protein
MRKYMFTIMAIIVLTNIGTVMAAAPANINFATNELPDGISITLNWSGTNNGNKLLSDSKTFVSNGPSKKIVTKTGTLFTYSGFPTSITVGSDTYSLLSTIPESGFITGSPGSSTTVIATYALEPIPPLSELSTSILVATGLIGLFGIIWSKKKY